MASFEAPVDYDHQPHLFGALDTPVDGFNYSGENICAGTQPPVVLKLDTRTGVVSGNVYEQGVNIHDGHTHPATEAEIKLSGREAQTPMINSPSIVTWAGKLVQAAQAQQ